ncbi:sugar phosphate nucleotidyltransferase [Pseudomonadales bacterium]|nr:sugar phosphate nucleotidyltransferase [Pseudomonadales bacterium]
MTQVVILAGGFGTRLRSVVSDVPKPMAPVNGKPFLAHQMELWKNQGVTTFILSVGYLSGVIIDFFKDSYLGVPVKYALEHRPLGTGGGLLLAMEELNSDEPFFLVNGDTYLGVDAEKILKFHSSKRSEVTLSLFRAEERDRFGGVKLTEGNRIVEFGPNKADISELANGGVYVVDPKAIRKNYRRSNKKISLEDEIWPDLLSDGCRFFGFEVDGDFLDIGVPSDYRSAGKVIRS